MPYIANKQMNPDKDCQYRHFSKTVLLIPDFASEVYGFLDRAHIGTSLVANVTLSMLISKLKNCLPVHHLMCEFEGETTVSLECGSPSLSHIKDSQGPKPFLNFSEVRP